MGEVRTQKIQKEVFQGELSLELKKIESRVGKESENKYFMLFFSMCVNFDEENMRNNRFLDVPIYASEDFMKTTFPGQKPKDLVDRRYRIKVDFSPQLRTFSGQKYCDFRAFVASMEEEL
jgi:CRISPR/Cas system-associated endoribonuclease Cas2